MGAIGEVKPWPDDGHTLPDTARRLAAPWPALLNGRLQAAVVALADDELWLHCAGEPTTACDLCVRLPDGSDAVVRVGLTRTAVPELWHGRILPPPAEQARHRRLLEAAAPNAYQESMAGTARPLPPPGQARLRLPPLQRFTSTLHPGSQPLAAVANSVEQELIDDPHRIARILALFRRSRAPATVRGYDGIGPQLRARWDHDGLLVSASATVLAPAGPILVDTALEWSTFEFVAPTIDQADRPPFHIIRRRRRRDRRVAAPRGVAVRLRPEACDEVEIRGRMLDLSARGIGLQLLGAPDRVCSGSCVQVELAWKGGTPLTCPGVVRHVSRRGDSVMCGVEFADASTTWSTGVEPLLHPVTQRGVVDGLWELYESSGYFSLSGKVRDQFFHLRHDFTLANHRLASAPALGGCFVHSSGGRTIGAISQLQFWPGSWLGYQLARTQFNRPFHSSGNNILAELYKHGYEHVQRDPDARWIVSYIQDAATWSRLINLELTARYTGLGRGSITPFHAIELRTDVDEQGLQAAEIRLATAEESHQLARHVAGIQPQPYVRATGLQAPLTELDGLRKRWRDAGLMRERSVIVARVRGAAVAAMVLDCGHTGLHLFHLTEVCRVWALTDEGTAYYEALIQYARQWFRGLGHSHFTLFWEDSAPVPELHGARDLGWASTIVLDVALVPELLEHVLTTLTDLPSNPESTGP